MADDQLYLACRVCGDVISLFKYYASGGFIREDWVSGDGGGPVGNWIDEHVHTWGPSVPDGHVPELLNSNQVHEMSAELQDRRQRWADGDTDGENRSYLNPYQVVDGAWKRIDR